VPSSPVTVPPIVNVGAGTMGRSSTIVSTEVGRAQSGEQLGSDSAKFTVLAGSAMASCTICALQGGHLEDPHTTTVNPGDPRL